MSTMNVPLGGFRCRSHLFCHSSGMFYLFSHKGIWPGLPKRWASGSLSSIVSVAPDCGLTRSENEEEVSVFMISPSRRMFLPGRFQKGKRDPVRGLRLRLEGNLRWDRFWTFRRPLNAAVENKACRRSAYGPSGFPGEACVYKFLEESQCLLHRQAALLPQLLSSMYVRLLGRSLLAARAPWLAHFNLLMRSRRMLCLGCID